MPRKGSNPDVAWVRAQVPHKVRLVAHEVATRTGLTVHMVYTVMLSKHMYDVDPEELAAEIISDLFSERGHQQHVRNSKS